MFSFIFLNGPIRIVLGVVVLTVLIVILTRFNRRKHPSKSSLDILEERLERGEISQAEYDEAKQRQGKE